MRFRAFSLISSTGKLVFVTVMPAPIRMSLQIIIDNHRECSTSNSGNRVAIESHEAKAISESQHEYCSKGKNCNQETQILFEAPQIQV